MYIKKTFVGFSYVISMMIYSKENSLRELVGVCVLLADVKL
jgi:hypothetical protein